MKGLELRIPPPLWALLFALAMVGVAWAAPTQSFLAALAGTVRWGLAAAIGLAGIGVTLAGIVQFRRARTTIDPTQPHKASSLVGGGIYRLTRNPMYLGLLLVLVAWAVFLASPWAWLGPLGFVLAMTRWQIGPEERALEALFGTEYRSYCARVRRWI